MSKHACVKACPKEFRDKVVQLMQAANRSTGKVAKEFDISPDSVRAWGAAVRARSGQPEERPAQCGAGGTGAPAAGARPAETGV